MSATNDIPALTMPIQSTTTTTTSSAVSITSEKNSATFVQSPAISTSESSRTLTEGENHANIRCPPLPLPLPQSLRKSVSVDSFPKFSRESSRPSRGYTVSDKSSSQHLVYEPPPDSSSGSEKYNVSARHRGESLSTVYVEQNPSPSESDIDRYDLLTRSSTERFRHSSLKNQEMQKPHVRGGELPLPSRTQQNTNLTSLNINNMTNFPTARPPLTSHSSFDSSKRGSSYTTLNSSRSRSGSLGIYVANSLTWMATNSQGFSPVSKSPRRAYLRFCLKFSTAVFPFPRKAHCSCCHRHIKFWKIDPHPQGSFRIRLNGSDSSFWAYSGIKFTSVSVAPLYRLIRHLIVKL